MLPCPGYDKQCCDEHWGACVSFRSGFLGVYAQKWDCWVILCLDSGIACCRAPSCTHHYLSICEKMSVPGFFTRIGAPLGRSWSSMSPQELSLVPFSAPGMWLLLSNCHLAHYFLGLDATHLNLQGTKVKQRRTGSEDSGKLQQKPVKHSIPLKSKTAARQNKNNTVY